ncbi:hypothetical protein Scep_030842 [Stephania cephalantha]|uniref:Uncharacterized protein n=1 Tax=Stephania cephalantha TaxID=152367 RepID=A0AAP0E0J7_9MAGN
MMVEGGGEELAAEVGGEELAAEVGGAWVGFGEPDLGFLAEVGAPGGVVGEEAAAEADEDGGVEGVDGVGRGLEAHLGVGEVEDEVLSLFASVFFVFFVFFVVPLKWRIAHRRHRSSSPMRRDPSLTSDLSLSLSQTPNPSLPRNLRPQHPDPCGANNRGLCSERRASSRIRPFKNNSSPELIDPLQFEPRAKPRRELKLKPSRST